jgi:hypothetical protein
MVGVVLSNSTSTKSVASVIVPRRCQAIKAKLLEFVGGLTKGYNISNE